MQIQNVWVSQIQDKKISPVFADLLIKNGKIESLIPKDFKSYLKNTDKTGSGKNTLDAGGRVLTIPNVNFHEHFYSRLAKGLSINGPTDNFTEILKNLWWKLDLALDEQMVKASVLMGAMESIYNGVTYTFDHHASPNFTKGSLDVIAETVKSMGMRSVLCFETSDRNGPELTSQALAEHRRFYESGLDHDIKMMLGLHASFTLSDNTLKDAAALVNDLGLGIHIHLCEDESDRTESLKRFNNLPARRLAKFKLMSPKGILSHGIHLIKEDYLIISGEGSAIAYNPDSNLNNGVGVPDFLNVPNEIPILSGTDGMHANPARSLKQLFLFARHQNNSFEESFNWFQKLFFDQYKFIRQYFPDFTSLHPGERADFVIWDYVPPAEISEQNFWGHYIYGILERPVHSVIQNGQPLLKNGRMMIDNEDAINREIHQQGIRLAKSFKNM
ncbi:MAG: amidohydrolase family protein [Calditrichaceae bacterium]